LKQHIDRYGILGISYCGSTLLSSILGQSPRTFSCGETHWILDKRDTFHCTVHPKKCDFWTKELLEELNIKNYYNRVVEEAYSRYKCTSVIFSDKNSCFYLPAIENGAIITKFILLFRKPEAFATSWLKKPANKNKSLNTALMLYRDGYNKNLELAKGFNVPLVKVFYDDFVNNPAQFIRILCKKLYIQYTPKMLDYWNITEKTHNIGGNAMMWLNVGREEKFDQMYQQSQKTDLEWYKTNKKKIIPDNRWEEWLTKEQKNVILNSDAQKVFEGMMENRLV